MKKIIIAAVVVCMAVFAQAANWNWGATNGYLWDAKGTSAAGGAKIAEGATAYLFDAATITQTALLVALTDGTYKSVAEAFDAKGVAVAPVLSIAENAKFATSADFAYGDTSSTYNFYAVVIAPDSVNNAAYITDSVTIEATPMESATTIGIASMTKPSQAGVIDADAFTSAGWYDITVSGGNDGPTGVPEPTTGLLLLIGVAGLALRRKA